MFAKGKIPERSHCCPSPRDPVYSTLSVIDNCKLVKNTLSGIFGSMVCKRASCLENYRDKKLSGKLFMLWNRSGLVFGGDCPWCGNRLNNPDIKNRRHWALGIILILMNVLTKQNTMLAPQKHLATREQFFSKKWSRNCSFKDSDLNNPL